MISKKDIKLLKIIGAVFGVLFVMYLIHNAYSSYTGNVVTEYALNYTQIESITVDGFAVRDEGNGKGKSNDSFLYKNQDKVYVSLVADSANVSKNDSIALAFSSDSAAEAYRERLALKDKITSLSELKSQGGLSYVNVLGLNSLIYSSVMDYAEAIDSVSIDELPKIADNITQKITTKQIATGEKMDFDSAIESYKAEYASLESALGDYERVKSPYAGYFVSSVDGYENTISYDDVKDKNLKPKTGEKLISAENEVYENIYGKIVGQFTWYFVYDLSASQISSVNEGSIVYVNFPGRGIENVKMSVYDITEADDSVITVTLRCKMMNEDLVTLRKEKAEIVIKKYTGLKINRSAIVKNDEGIDGVYVLSGNLVEFSPVDIKYYGDEYVIADKYYIYKEDEEGNTIIDYEATDKYRAIKLYDNVILKGKNLEDGKIID